MSRDLETTFCRKFSALNMKAKRYTEMSAANCPETQLHIPEEPNTKLGIRKVLFVYSAGVLIAINSLKFLGQNNEDFYRLG